MRPSQRSAPILRLAPALTALVLVGPVAAGLLWTALPAFGWLPAIGGEGLSLQPWRSLFLAPGFATALRLSISVGLATTLLALLLALGFCAWRAARPRRRGFDRLLAPLLGSPHSAMALGFAFLIMPSGWLVRLVSPWLTGWLQPPVDLVTVQDPYGISLIVGLLLKEVPYLVLMMLAASAQVQVEQTLAVARALGQESRVAWLKTVFPQLYRQIRLPIFAVLAFSLSAVDVGTILAPTNPPPLALLAVRWLGNYDLALYFPAAAACLLQLLIALLAIGLWLLAERLVAALGRRWLERGARDRQIGIAIDAASALVLLLGGLGMASLLAMAVWSVATSWRFPDLLPQGLQGGIWREQAGRALELSGATLVIGLIAVAASLLLSLACLENEQRRNLHPGYGVLWLLYLPLLVPQIAFLFGVQTVLVKLGLDGTILGVGWTHLTFVLPYMFLSLVDPFRALDPRYAASAAALGAGPWRVFFTVKLPLLTRPVLSAVAVGFSVSLGLYLPTLFAGAGRVATLTTEAVTLATGADRRVIGVFVVLQSALPLLIYAIALVLPVLLFRHRRDMRR
jgi:putative thiamine transport system permease protein